MTDLNSIFGDLDVDEIGDDPFGIANGTYWAVVTDAKISEKDGNYALTFQWQIDEPGNEYNANKVSEFYPIYPGKKNSDLDADELKRMKFLKRRMRRGFGMSEGEMKSLKPQNLIGKFAYITVVNNPAKDNSGRIYINVTEALTKDLYDEEVGAREENISQGAASLGL